jgi:hypothetical protein
VCDGQEAERRAAEAAQRAREEEQRRREDIEVRHPHCSGACTDVCLLVNSFCRFAQRARREAAERKAAELAELEVR